MTECTPLDMLDPHDSLFDIFITKIIQMANKKKLRILPASTIGGNNPGRSFDGVKIIPFHQVSFKTLAFNSLLGGGSYKQFPSAAT